MHCEFCVTDLNDLASARRHMLSAAHMRAKRSYDLTQLKFKDRVKQATLQPKSSKELLKLLNIHSTNDLDAMNKRDFFKIETVYASKIARELISILHDSIVNYHIDEMPDPVRQPFVEIIEKRNASNPPNKS